MVKCTMTEACVDGGMYGMPPVTHAHFTGAKGRVQCLLKLAKAHLCSSKRMSHLKHRTVVTHMKSELFLTYALAP